MLPVVCDGCLSAITAAQLSTRDNSNCTNHIGTSASKSIRHCTSVAETCGEPEVGVDAEIRLDSLHQLVKEGDIFAALISPALIEAIRHDKDSRVVRNSLETIVGQGSALVGVLAVDNLLRTAAELMPGEDQSVGLVLVVVVRNVQEVVSILPVHLHRVLLVREGFRLAAACGVGRKYRGH